MEQLNHLISAYSFNFDFFKEFKDKGSRRAPHQRPRRVSLQPPASSSKDMHSELKQQTRRRSEPALSVSVCSDDFADRGVSREHRIQEHMKLTSGLSQNTPAQKHDGYHHNKNNRNHHKSQGGSGGRKVSFVPFLEETGLAPVREEESEIDWKKFWGSNWVKTFQYSTFLALTSTTLNMCIEKRIRITIIIIFEASRKISKCSQKCSFKNNVIKATHFSHADV